MKKIKNESQGNKYNKRFNNSQGSKPSYKIFKLIFLQDFTKEQQQNEIQRPKEKNLIKKCQTLKQSDPNSFDANPHS